MQTCFSCWFLTFSCCFWSGDPVVSEETWINPTRAAFFLFLRLHSRWSRIAGNLTECVQVQLTWKLSRFFDTWGEAQFSSPIPVVPSLKKKKKKRKETKTVHSTNEDWYWKKSPSLCWTFRNWFVGISTFFTYSSSQFTWQGHRKLQWAMSKDRERLLSNGPLETAEPSINYARIPGYKKKYKKKTRKRREKRRKMNGVEIYTRAYVATRLLLRLDYLYAVTLKTKLFGDYNHARLEVSWITSTRGLLLRGYTGEPSRRFANRKLKFLFADCCMLISWALAAHGVWSLDRSVNLAS